ncbi:MAG: sterol desaturase family protein [Pseudomonadales bacterium]|nr:sterol desaturase family protein [Pseudomonadales bacterium]
MRVETESVFGWPLSFLKRMFRFEIPVISEKYRWLTTAFVVFFTFIFALNFLATMHLLAYLGPGLGDKPDYTYLLSMIDDLLNRGESVTRRFYFVSFLLLLITNVLFRFAMMVWGYLRYETVFGEKFPIRHVVNFMLLNAVSAFSIFLVLFPLGGLTWLLGFDFSAGWLAVEHMAAMANSWVLAYVPTLIDLPTPLPVILVFTIGGFFHYWFHRIGHSSRLCWLLFHRFHHMTPKLIQPTTQAVFVAVPLFLFAVIPYVFIFGAITKLFSAEPLYEQIILINLVWNIGEIFGHQTALYDKAIRWPLIRWIGYFGSGGIYHYMHHSSKVEHSRSGNNMVNIGGGFFFLWDHVFGTYTPLSPERPNVGLTGDPQLYMNPVRLAYSGIMQIVYELVHNKGWKQRFLILFGASDYKPPISRNFAIKNPN